MNDAEFLRCLARDYGSPAQDRLTAIADVLAPTANPSESCAPAAGPSAGVGPCYGPADRNAYCGSPSAEPCRNRERLAAAHPVGLQAEPVAWLVRTAHGGMTFALPRETGGFQDGAFPVYAAQERPAERAQTAGRIDRCGPRSVAFVTIDGDEAKFIYAGDSDIGAVVLDAWFAERAATGATP